MTKRDFLGRVIYAFLFTLFCSFNFSEPYSGTGLDDFYNIMDCDPSECPPNSILLTDWIQEGNPANGNWIVSSDGLTVDQTTNENPTFFVSPNDFFNTVIEGSFRVTSGVCDDFIGFVFGYQNPTGQDVDNYDLLLFDWKRANQSAPSLGFGNEGFALQRLSGTIPSTDYGPVFWAKDNHPASELLATDFSTTNGWQPNVTYQFRLEYFADNIKIFIDDVLIFDVSGTFEAGKFGFYNYSQPDVQYMSFSEEGTCFTFYADNDNDGFGDPNNTTEDCEAPEGFVENFDDCDDTNPSITTNCTEPCQTPMGDLIFTSQAEIDAFPADCNLITGHLIINGDDIVDLSNLIGITEVSGCVIIGDTTQNVIGNDILTNLNGLGGITSIGGDLIICQNPELVSLSGFSMLMSLGGDILVKNCIALENLNLVNLNFVGGDFTLSGLPLFIEFGPWNLTGISGTIIFDGLGWQNLSGFESIISIGGDFFILNNPNLVQIDLSNLIQLFGCFHVMNNTVLIEIPDLSNLEEIGDDLIICNNNEITNVDNLVSLESVGGTLKISGNNNLENLDSLINLIFIGDSLIITNNQILSQCCGLLPFLESDPTATILIENNPMGCNGIDDILMTCMDIVDEDNDGVDDLVDNCLGIANPNQSDEDEDGFGTACDCDDENPNINEDAIEVIGDNIDNNCDGEIDELSCEDFGDAGEICCDQILCPNNLNPAPITSVSLPNNGIGDFEYIWIITTNEPGAGNSSTWQIVPNSTGVELDLEEVNQTSWVRRCARVVGCEEYIWETNIVMITVLEDCEIDCSGFTLELGSKTDVSCFGEQDGNIDVITLGATGTVSYAWSNGMTTEDLDNIPEGVYSLVAIDSVGCEANIDVMVSEPNELIITGEVQNLSCANENTGYINTEISGGTAPYSYDWNDGLSTNSSIENLSPGLYSLIVTDSNNCSLTTEFIITSPEALSLTPLVNEVSCDGDDGLISLDINGGTPPLSLSWDNDLPNLPLQENLAAGTYNVTLSDVNACEVSAQITLTGPDPSDCFDCNDLSVSVNNIKDVSCNGESDGAIELSITNATEPVSFQWIPDLGDIQNPTGLPAGEYQVLVTDANGCTAEQIVMILQPDPISIMPTIQGISCYGESDGAISLEVNGGVSDYTFNWNDGFSSEQNLSNLSEGTYELELTDANACIAMLSIDIESPEQLSATFDVIDATCDNSDGSIDMEVSGGILPYIYNWSMGLGEIEDPQNLEAGTYKVTITDSNDCVLLGEVLVEYDCEYDCSDGQDNDGDGLIDCEDDDCNCIDNNFQFTQINAFAINENQSHITFSTRYETAIGYFILQHSKDGQSFNSISELKEGLGLNDSENEYSFVDENPKPGFNHYRIMYFDESQRFHFSASVVVIFEEEQTLLLHPNPVKDYLSVEFLKNREEHVELIILDNFGKIVHQETIHPTVIHTQIDLGDLPSSVYNLWTIEKGKKRQVDKFVKLR